MCNNQNNESKRSIKYIKNKPKYIKELCKGWEGKKNQTGFRRERIMQLVEAHILNTKEIEAICIKAKLLYNQSLYYLRQSLFGNIERFSEYELTGLFAKYSEETYKALR